MTRRDCLLQLKLLSEPTPINFKQRHSETKQLRQKVTKKPQKGNFEIRKLTRGGAVVAVASAFAAAAVAIAVVDVDVDVDVGNVTGVARFVQPLKD